MTGFRWNYLRDWVKVARELPKTRGHYPDGAVAALVFTFCKAAEQPEPGTFDSLPILRAILDATGSKRGRWVPYLVEHEDIVVLPDGRAILPNWRTFQEEGTSTERVRKHRENKRSGVTGNGHETFHGTDEKPYAGARPGGERSSQNVRTSDDVRSPSGLENGGARIGSKPEEPYRTLEELTGNWPVQRVEPNAIRTLDALCDRRGIPAVLEALRAEAPRLDPQPPAPWPLIAAARNRLEPFAAAKPAATGKGGVSAEEAERAFGNVR